MSDTQTAPVVEESIYPSLSEATENDVRESSEAIEQDQQPAEQPEQPTEPEAPPEESDEELKARNARLARTLREEKRKARQLELEAQALRGQRQEQPNEQIEREIAQRAAALAQQQAINDRANAVYSEGIKAFGRVEFDESVKAVNEAFGQMMPVVIDTVVDIDNAPQLFAHLADNPDIADTIAGLPPHKLGAALAREAAKISQPKVKPVSKAPPPIRPISTTSSAEPETDLEKMSMDELAKLWDKRDFQKRMGF